MENEIIPYLEMCQFYPSFRNEVAENFSANFIKYLTDERIEMGKDFLFQYSLSSAFHPSASIRQNKTKPESKKMI